VRLKVGRSSSVPPRKTFLARLLSRVPGSSLPVLRSDSAIWGASHAELDSLTVVTCDKPYSLRIHRCGLSHAAPPCTTHDARRKLCKFCSCRTVAVYRVYRVYRNILAILCTFGMHACVFS
jgi:hypothetical protein